MSDGHTSSGYQAPMTLQEAIGDARRLVVTAHVNPDPDGLGCALGLTLVLRSAGRVAVPVCIGRRPSFASSLPGHELLVQFPSRLDEAGDVAPVLQPGDGLIVVDTPSAARMEAFHSIHESVLRDCRVIVFDHHFTNEQFGNVNYVDPSAAATAEVIGDVLDGSRLPLDLDSATCFMAALLADTQCFRTENTSGRSLYWGQRLVAAGAPIYALARLLLIARPYSALKLWGAALSRLQSDGPVYWTVVDQVMLREAQATIEDLEGLVDFILSSPEAMIAIVLKEDVPGETKVSMRTVPGVDATRIVGRFNGGGHQRAAGCTIAAGPEDAARLLLPLAAEELLAGAPAA